MTGPMRDFLLTLRQRAVASYRFWRHVVVRFWKDDLMTKSAALGFQTTLALVPLFTIVFSMLSIFPSFQETVGNLQEGLLSIVAPHTQAVLEEQLGELVGRARTVGAVGALALAVIAMMLLHTISGTLDAIFRVTRKRSLATRFLTYWALLTLGPVIFAVGFSLTASAFGEGATALGGALQAPVNVLKALLPFFVEWLGFTLLYWIVPSRAPAFRDAMAAAAVAAILFQILKGGFALYLLYFASYETLYGALAAIPITLLWLEFIWANTLLGATIAAALPEWRAGRDSAGNPLIPYDPPAEPSSRR